MATTVVLIYTKLAHETSIKAKVRSVCVCVHMSASLSLCLYQQYQKQILYVDFFHREIQLSLLFDERPPIGI